MKSNSKYSIGSILVLVLSLIASSVEAGRGGGGFGGNRGFNNNNGIRDNNGIRNNNVYNNGYYYQHNNDDYNTAVVIDANGDNTCQTTQVCNSYGQCTTEDDCDQ